MFSVYPRIQEPGLRRSHNLSKRGTQILPVKAGGASPATLPVYVKDAHTSVRTDRQVTIECIVAVSRFWSNSYVSTL